MKLSRLILLYEKFYGQRYIVELNPEVFENLSIEIVILT